jgi:hypothetical protein
LVGTVVALSIPLILSLSKDARMLFQAKNIDVSCCVAKYLHHGALEHHAASFDKLRMGKVLVPTSIQPLLRMSEMKAADCRCEDEPAARRVS